MRKKGFTLIELLIVIAIIAILATIIIIALSNARPRANRAAAVSSLNETLKVAQACIVDGYTLNKIDATGQTAGSEICSNTTAAPLEGKWPSTINNYTVVFTSTNPAIGVDGYTITQSDAQKGQTAITCTKSASIYTSCK